MNAQDTLGACLGFTLFKSKLKDAPEKIDITIYEEEEIQQPPVMFMYSLDGKIKMYQTIISDWKNDDLLKTPEEVQVDAGLNTEKAKVKSVLPSQKFEEQKKMRIVIPEDYSYDSP